MSVKLFQVGYFVHGAVMLRTKATTGESLESREFNLLTVRPKGNRNLLSGMISGSTSPRTRMEEMTLQRLFLCREMPDRLIWRALLR